MTLASRTSRARPLTESVEAYDNPDTPGTTYSFQDQASLKPTIQAEISHHLVAPILDASMLMSTDDEMLDSDSDRRREEDFDIDLDAEVYSISGGDLEISMTMEDDSVVYGHVEPEADNDDIMLDDEPVEYSPDISDTLHSYTEATTGDTHELLNSDETLPLISVTPDPQQPESTHETSNDQSEPGLKVSPQVPFGSKVNKLDSVDVENTTDHHPEHARDGIHDGAEQRKPSPLLDVEPAVLPNTPLEQEEHDGSQSSTATLTHEAFENDERYPVSDIEHATGHELQVESEFSRPVDPGISRGEDSYDGPYQCPVIVQYGQIQLALFPPMADWSEDFALAEVYSDIPSSYLLKDVGLCDKPLVELFVGLRGVLDDSVGGQSELVVDIELLGLKIGEDNTACKFITLRRILDLHNQLHENDGYDIALPVNMSLYTVPRFHTRLDAITAAVRERKGLQECLSILELPPVDDYPNQIDAPDHPADAIDTNDRQRAIHSPFARDKLEHASMDENESADQDIPKDAQVEVRAGDEVINQETNTISSVDEVAENSTEHDESTFPVSDTRTTKAVEHPEISRRGSTEDEEELLEYEDENYSAQVSTDQPKAASPLTHLYQDKPSPEPNDDEGDEQVLDNDQSDSESGSTDVRLHQEAFVAAESEQGGLPSNPDKENSNKPSPIPVLGGDDGHEGEYDNEQQDLEENGYDQGEEREMYQGQSEHGFEDGYVSIERNSDQDRDGTGDAESYAEASLQDDGFTAKKNQHADSNHPDFDDYQSGDYYEGNQGDYIEQEGAGFIQGGAEPGVYDFEEYDESRFEIAGADTPDEDGVVGDLSATDAIDVVARSPVSTHEEEELIDYEDDEDEQLPTQLHKTTSNMSPTSLKRFRGDSNDQDDGDEVDENQASKRVRAE